MPAQVPAEVSWKPLRYKRHPVTGRPMWWDSRAKVWIEKDQFWNLKQRRRIHELCEQTTNPTTWEFNQKLQLTLCRESFLYFLNIYGFTFVQIKHTFEGRKPNVADSMTPFITFPAQDDAAETLIRSTGIWGDPTTSICIDKSREMGATWLSLAIIVWLFLFHQDVSILMCADRQEAVDYQGRPSVPDHSSADKDTLFGKIDYMLALLPKWMTPMMTRTAMHLTNHENGSRIDGSTTRDDLGRGGRRTLVFIDEAAAIRHLRAIDKSTADTTHTRWFNSTPKGAHYYSELRSSGKLQVIVLGWWDHPWKGCDGPNGEPGRYIAFDPDKGEEVITGWWREMEKRRRPSIQDVAENIDIDHLGAGRIVFDLGVLNRHLATYCYPAPHRLLIQHQFDGERRRISIRNRVVEDIILREDPNKAVDDVQGVLLWWGGLVPDDDGRLRPPQDQTYILAADVSGGNGASNSVISIRSRNTGEKVGEYADANISPDQLAEIMAMLGIWVGGPHGCGYLIWEANGPGNRTGKTLARTLAYPWLHEMRTTTRRFNIREQAQRLGWWNSGQSKRDAAEALRAAYAAGTFINHSAAAVQEAMKWVRYENRDIGPGFLEAESSEARATHGDRVVADMLTEVAMEFAGLTRPKGPRYPAGSVGDDLERMLEEADDEDGVWVV